MQSLFLSVASFFVSLTQINDLSIVIRVLTVLYYIINAHLETFELPQFGFIILQMFSGSLIMNFILTDSLPCMLIHVYEYIS